LYNVLRMNNKKQLVGVIIGVTLVTIGATASILLEKAVGKTIPTPDDAPVVISGDDIYVTWWTNKTGNDEVMFRAM
jgi:hypothetical protein